MPRLTQKSLAVPDGDHASQVLCAPQKESIALIKSLSKSNFGVYLAIDKEMETRYAMKIFPYDKSG